MNVRSQILQFLRALQTFASSLLVWSVTGEVSWVVKLPTKAKGTSCSPRSRIPQRHRSAGSRCRGKPPA